eukprot:2764880-Amphidinium_carterae.1
MQPLQPHESLYATSPSTNRTYLCEGPESSALGRLGFAAATTLIFLVLSDLPTCIHFADAKDGWSRDTHTHSHTHKDPSCGLSPETQELIVAACRTRPADANNKDSHSRYFLSALDSRVGLLPPSLFLCPWHGTWEYSVNSLTLGVEFLSSNDLALLRHAPFQGTALLLLVDSSCCNFSRLGLKRVSKQCC